MRSSTEDHSGSIKYGSMPRKEKSPSPSFLPRLFAFRGVISGKWVRKGNDANTLFLLTFAIYYYYYYYYSYFILKAIFYSHIAGFHPVTWDNKKDIIIIFMKYDSYKSLLINSLMTGTPNFSVPLQQFF